MRHLIIAVALLSSSSLYAMRCGTDLVNEGDTRQQVLSVCGTPTADDYSTMEYVNLQGDGMNYYLHIGSGGTVDRISWSR